MKSYQAPSQRPRTVTGGLIAIAVAGLAAATSLPLAAQTAAASTASSPPSPSSPSAKPAPAAPKQLVFATPEAGVDALVAALRANDAKQLARLLGPGHQRIVDSGDNAADRAAWARFVADYDTKHELKVENETKATLSIGANDWPMPIPLVKRKGGWAFDAAAGEEEIVARRIGHNELDAIQVCLAVIDAEREYAEVDRNGDGILEYTPRLISSPGKRDGLYWPTQPGEPPSPAGPRLAYADPKLKEGGTGGQPYHGYYYRVVTAQGKNAPGGARNYVANGKLIGGIGLVAYPAGYLASGVKTFICNMDGIVYEKDLGPDTKAVATKIKAYDPDASWAKAK